MTRQGTLLIVDDNRSILTAVKMLMEDTFREIITLGNPNRLHALLSGHDIDVVLLDMNFSAGINTGNEGLYWLREIKKLKPQTAVVLFTAYADIALAVSGIKEGAADFVVKPFDNRKLHDVLVAARDHRPRHRDDDAATSREESAMVWGSSAVMQRLRTTVEKVAATDANMLITGENGTGKEMLAREVHRLSARHAKPMVSVDMGALTETLFESELFGHKKGAFTDAKTDRVGKFEAADGSTLFLDEIGNLPYHLQAKLLTVVQRRSVTPVGGNKSVPVNIRLICATNRDLQDMVAHGQFREDLLYRINTIQVHLPPLRERQEDIVPLAAMFLRKFADIYGKPATTLAPDAAEKLRVQPWYGNIRELEHTMEKAVIMSESRTLTAADIDCPKTNRREKPLDEATSIEEMEYNLIRTTIEKCEGNLSAVASRLGISRQTLYNKLKRYGL